MKKIIFTIAAFLLFASAALAQGSIAGTITDAKGKGIGNVTVLVVGPGGKAVATATSDGDGAYALDEIAAGKYKIATYGAKGYAAAFRDEVLVTDDDTTTVDITLTAAAQPPVPKPSVKPTPQPSKPAVPAESGIWIKIIDGSKPGNNIIATVTYDQSGNAITRREEGITTYVFTIPENATNIQLSIDVAGVDEGVTWPILKKVLTGSDLDKCYKVVQDVRDMRWNNDCQ